MKQLGKFTIISILILCRACHISKKNQCISIIPQYKLNPKTVTYTYDDGKSKTVTEYDTMLPLGKIYGCGKQYFYHAKYFDSNKYLLSKSKLTISGTNNWVNFEAAQTQIRYDFLYSTKDSLLFANKITAYQLWQKNNIEGIIETNEKV